jgi:hypothetical protein
MKSLRLIQAAPAALLLLATVSTPSPAREQVKDVQVYDTGKTPRLSVKNINGGLTIEGWDKNRLEVTVTKTAETEEMLGQIDVISRMDDDYLRIEVDLEDLDRDGNRNYRGDILKVDFEIKVPRGTRIDAVEFVNGNVELSGINGDIDASTVNGRVSGEDLGGDVELATVNGELELVASGDVDSIRMHSVNGGVTLVLPKKFDANISAGTLHGDIRGMNGLEVDATKFTGSSIQGRIGKGGLKVDLNTVNGSIEIRREGEGGAREKE